jgi:hypothetical protein
MARFNSARNSFLSGEITPRALGRFDLEQFSQACETLKNAILLPQGGATRRPGTELLEAATTELQDKLGSEDYVRMVPFVFNANEVYNVIFLKNVNKPVIIKNNGDVVAAASITRKTPSIELPTSITTIDIASWDGFTEDQQLEEIQYVQVNDFLFITQKDHPPFAVVRTAADTFEIRQFSDYVVMGVGPLGAILSPASVYARPWPFMDKNITSLTVTIGSTSQGASTTLTASSALFNAGHVGTIWQITNSAAASTGYCVVTGFTSSTVVSVENVSSFADTTATTNWYEPAWSDYRGWPRAVGYYEQRLVYGGSESIPGTLWGTQVADIMQLSLDVGATATNTDPFMMTPAGTQANEIQWLSPSKTLRMGTLGQEMSLAGTDNSLGLGPGNLGYTEQTNYGSQYKMSVKVDNAPIFVQRSGGVLRELVFNFEEDNFRANNLSFLADHMVPDSQLTYQQDRGIVWCKRKDLVASSSREYLFMGITRDKNTGVLGFHQHLLGGITSGVGTPTIQSIISLPSDTEGFDQVWLAVKRWADGAPKIYIERMTLPFEYELTDMAGFSGITPSVPVYVDCACVKSAALGATTITGLDDVYEDQEVDVFSTIGYVGRFTVTANTITLSSATTAARSYVIGFPYETAIQPTEVTEGNPLGTGVGAMKRIDRASFKFYKTGYAKFGVSKSSNYDEINFRDSSLAPGTVTPLFTGDKDVIVNGAYDRNLQVVVKSDLPFPLTVLSITYRGATND